MANTSGFVDQLQRSLREFAPPPAHFHSTPRQAKVPESLSSCPAVFVRVDAVKRPLTQPYVGPYEILQRGDKTFILSRGGKPWTVTVDRLKPYFLPVMSAPPSSNSPSLSTSPPAARTPLVGPLPPAASVDSPSAAPSRSRFGRRLRPPDRYSP